MADQLLWLETLLKGSIGLFMLCFPITISKVAGLPHGGSAFWPRLFGVALLSIAAAFAVEGYSQYNPKFLSGGLSLGGAIVINAVTIVALIGTLVFRSIASLRGIVLVWSLCLLLSLLTLFEIANA